MWATVRTWSALPQRPLLSTGRLGEVALIATLLAALVFAASDGNAGDGVIDPVAKVALTRTVAVYTDPAHVRVIQALPLPPLELPIPTAPPATILIPSLDVHRPVEQVGVDRSGTMYTPQNLWNAGWYQGGPVPGAPGDAVIEGHAGYPKAPLLFAGLRQLHPGDRIIVVLADGSRRLFLVDSLTIWPARTGPPGMGEPYGPARLTLITCTGPFDDHYKTYADRLAVEATYAGLA